MTAKKIDKRPHAMGEGEPVRIDVISETERIITYPDGLVIHETSNRPSTAADARWLIAMVADLVPQFKVSDQLRKEGAEEEDSTGGETNSNTNQAA